MVYVVIVVFIAVLFLIAGLSKEEPSRRFLSGEISSEEDESMLPEDGKEYEFFLKTYIAGVHVASRKKYILDCCSPGNYMWLSHDKKNRYSKKAISIRDWDYTLLGYIPEIYCDDVMPILDKDHQCRISEIKYDGSYLDVYIIIEVEKDSA